MRDPNPTVVLIPGLGMIAWGKDKSESRVTAEFYNCAVEVMRGAEAIDKYIALPQQEAFDIEYWLLEEAKLKRMPAEKELARQVIVVIGAGSGIGKETAHRLVKEGAHIVCVDSTLETAKATAKEITAKHGQGIGVAGTGISGCGPAVGLACEHHRPRQRPRHARPGRAGLRRLRFHLRHRRHLRGRATPPATFPTTSGPSPSASTSPAATSSATRRFKTWKEQGLAAASCSPPPPTPPSRRRVRVAYDTSKAAANHLVRELAIELSPLVRVNGVAPATVVQGSAMFPRDRVIGSLAKYNIPYTDDEATESLVSEAQRSSTPTAR
jgi:NAD(P)-dependent dehydrogenase (short-subunit alcohol dehydrogenase family)